MKVSIVFIWYFRVNFLPENKMAYYPIQSFYRQKLRVDNIFDLLVRGLETLSEIEKMLVTSIFCFSQNVCLTLSQMTIFRTGPNQKSLQMTISNLINMTESSLNEQKTLREKEKLLTISPFPAVFSEDFNCGPVKTRACLGKG